MPTSAQEKPRGQRAIRFKQVSSSVKEDGEEDKVSEAGSASSRRAGNPRPERPEKGENSIKVCIRVRPISKEEASKSGHEVVLCTSAHTVRMTPPLPNQDGAVALAPSHIMDYSFDLVLPSSAMQHAVYDSVGARLVQGVANGFHGCAFTYGQTGSGKSHTIFGGAVKNPSIVCYASRKEEEDRGLVARMAEGLFSLLGQQSEEHMVKISYMELYNEKVRDLLTPSPDEQAGSLDVREHAKIGVYVKGLSKNVVQSPADVARLLDFGHKIRVVGCTNMNAMSSRSHAIVTLYVESLLDGADSSQGDREPKSRMRRRAQVHAVDLAGSERLRHAGENETRQKESKQINKSLLALGQMILRLVEKEQAVRKGAPGAPHIPYRNSKLTLLLSEALMGNCRTTMLACISPAASSFWMSESTLRFASSVKKLHTRPVKNEEAEGDLVRLLQAEVASLRQQLTEAKSPRAPKKELQDKLSFGLYLENELSTTWDESEAITRNADNERRKTLMRLGLLDKSVPQESNDPGGRGEPFLVNVCDDAFFSGCLSYSLTPGQTVWIGSDPSCKIKVDGLGVQPRMCCLVCVDNITVEIRLADAVAPPSHPPGGAWAGTSGRTRKATVSFAEEADEKAEKGGEEENVEEAPRRRSSLGRRDRGVARQFGSLFKRSVAEVFVNGRKVHRRRELEDGDHIRVGSTHAFKLSIPGTRRRSKQPGELLSEASATSIWSKEYALQLQEYVGQERAAKALRELLELQPLVDEANDITDELRGGEDSELVFKLNVLCDMLDADEDPVVTVSVLRIERPTDVTKAGPTFEGVRGFNQDAVWTGAQFQRRLDALRDLWQEVSSRDVAWGEPNDMNPWKDDGRIPLVSHRASSSKRPSAGPVPTPEGVNTPGGGTAPPAAEAVQALEAMDFEAQQEELLELQRRVPEIVNELMQVKAELADKDEQLKRLPGLQRQVRELKEELSRVRASSPPDPGKEPTAGLVLGSQYIGAGQTPQASDVSTSLWDPLSSSRQPATGFVYLDEAIDLAGSHSQDPLSSSSSQLGAYSGLYRLGQVPDSPLPSLREQQPSSSCCSSAAGGMSYLPSKAPDPPVLSPRELQLPCSGCPVAASGMTYMQATASQAVPAVAAEAPAPVMQLSATGSEAGPCSELPSSGQPTLYTETGRPRSCSPPARVATVVPAPGQQGACGSHTMPPFPLVSAVAACQTPRRQPSPAQPQRQQSPGRHPSPTQLRRHPSPGRPVEPVASPWRPHLASPPQPGSLSVPHQGPGPGDGTRLASPVLLVGGPGPPGHMGNTTSLQVSPGLLGGQPLGACPQATTAAVAVPRPGAVARSWSGGQSARQGVSAGQSPRQLTTPRRNPHAHSPQSPPSAVASSACPPHSPPALPGGPCSSLSPATLPGGVVATRLAQAVAARGNPSPRGTLRPGSQSPGLPPAAASCAQGAAAAVPGSVKVGRLGAAAGPAPAGEDGVERWQLVQGEVARLRRELDALSEICSERR